MISDEAEESMVSSLEALSIFGLGAYMVITFRFDCAFKHFANGSYQMHGIGVFANSVGVISVQLA